MRRRERSGSTGVVKRSQQVGRGKTRSSENESSSVEMNLDWRKGSKSEGGHGGGGRKKRSEEIEAFGKGFVTKVGISRVKARPRRNRRGQEQLGERVSQVQVHSKRFKGLGSPRTSVCTKRGRIRGEDYYVYHSRKGFGCA